VIRGFDACFADVFVAEVSVEVDKFTSCEQRRRIASLDEFRAKKTRSSPPAGSRPMASPLFRIPLDLPHVSLERYTRTTRTTPTYLIFYDISAPSISYALAIVI
jgi:hypothetical protein